MIFAKNGKGAATAPIRGRRRDDFNAIFNALYVNGKIAEKTRRRGARKRVANAEQNAVSSLIFRLRNDFAVRKRGAKRVGARLGRLRTGNVYFRQFLQFREF